MTQGSPEDKFDPFIFINIPASVWLKISLLLFIGLICGLTSGMLFIDPPSFIYEEQIIKGVLGSIFPGLIFGLGLSIATFLWNRPKFVVMALPIIGVSIVSFLLADAIALGLYMIWGRLFLRF